MRADRERVSRNFAEQSTDELIRFWQEADRAEWQPLAFEVVQEILAERGVSTADLPERAREVEPPRATAPEIARPGEAVTPPPITGPAKWLILIGAGALLLIAIGVLAGVIEPPISARSARWLAGVLVIFGLYILGRRRAGSKSDD